MRIARYVLTGIFMAIIASLLPTLPSAAASSADTKPRAAADQGPDLTTATYGDWQLRCGLLHAAAGKPDAHNCEVIQNIVLRGRNQPFAQAGFGRLASGQPLYFTVVVPVSVSFPTTIKVSTGVKDEDPVNVPFTRCLPAGCFASIEMTQSILERFRANNGSGFLAFKDGHGRNVKVPISFNGLRRALDAYQKRSGSR